MAYEKGDEVVWEMPMPPAEFGSDWRTKITIWKRRGNRFYYTFNNVQVMCNESPSLEECLQEVLIHTCRELDSTGRVAKKFHQVRELLGSKI